MTTIGTSSSNSTPSSAAPWLMSSRLTLRANALSFNFLRTDGYWTRATSRPGWTIATAITNPVSSSRAKSHLAIARFRGTPLKLAWPWMARTTSSG